VPRRMTLAGLLLLASSACVSVTGPRAVRPGTTRFGGNGGEVDSLTPLLEWQPEPEAPPATRSPPQRADAILAAAEATVTSTEPSVCYDFAVHDVVYEPERWGMPERRWAGARMYYRECLASTSHRLESPLLPGQDYFWFVRTRRGDVVGPWSRYQYALFVLVAGFAGSSYAYTFRTPERHGETVRVELDPR
jgi:hypothetical protein